MTYLIITIIFIIPSLLVWWYYIRYQNDVSGAKFAIGQRVLLHDMIVPSMLSTGNHMPIHGEIVKIRRNHNFRYEYDVIADAGEYMTSVYQHNIGESGELDEAPTRTIFTSILAGLDEI